MCVTGRGPEGRMGVREAGLRQPEGAAMWTEADGATDMGGGRKGVWERRGHRQNVRGSRGAPFWSWERVYTVRNPSPAVAVPGVQEGGAAGLMRGLHAEMMHSRRTLFWQLSTAGAWSRGPAGPGQGPLGLAVWGRGQGLPEVVTGCRGAQ